jgi:hypothetical protein
MASVVEAAPSDVASWLEIVREVEPLFGPMPGFEEFLLRQIEQQRALCVRSSTGGVAGGITYRRLIPGHAD